MGKSKIYSSLNLRYQVLKSKSPAKIAKSGINGIWRDFYVC